MRRMITKNQLDDAIKSTKKDISTLVDKDGNNRFIEGVGTIPDDFKGTITYNRWSLSGTHLMIVIAGEVNADTLSGEIVSITNLPSWVLNKVVPSSGTYIEFQQVPFYVDYTGSNVSIEVDKISQGILIQFTSSTTFTEKKKFRIQVDLLIDAQ